MSKTKNAKIPKEVWNFHKELAKHFGFNEATKGFAINHKLMTGEIKLKKKKNNKDKKYHWEIEMEEL